MAERDIICILTAYLLGGICTGYYLVRFQKRSDIREYGSGGVGARNVGRILGCKGFICTLSGDALKGSISVLLARRFAISEPAAALVLFAVTVGHIWPLMLQFRGGRGVATSVGAYLAYDYQLVLILLTVTLLLMVFRRGFVLSGLAAFLILPVAAYLYYDIPGHEVTALAGSAAIILFAHRDRIRKIFSEVYPSQKEA